MASGERLAVSPPSATSPLRPPCGVGSQKPKDPLGKPAGFFSAVDVRENPTGLNGGILGLQTTM